MKCGDHSILDAPATSNLSFNTSSGFPFTYREDICLQTLTSNFFRYSNLPTTDQKSTLFLQPVKSIRMGDVIASRRVTSAFITHVRKAVFMRETTLTSCIKTVDTRDAFNAFF